MRLLLVTIVALACSIGATSGPGRTRPVNAAVTCEAAGLKRLMEPALFESFFHCLDSMRHVQYPNGDQDTTHSVDMNPLVLSTFLERLDYPELISRGEAEMTFQFNIAPAGYSDPPVCTDKVTIQYLPDECAFRMVITSHFLVPPNWCTGQQVVYGFRIGPDRILDFGRNEAG